MHIIDVYNTYISKTCNKRIENYFIIHMIYASVNRTFYRLNSCSEKLFANVREKQQKSQNIFCDVVNLRKKSTSCDTKMAELSSNEKSTKYVTLSPYGYKKLNYFLSIPSISHLIHFFTVWSFLIILIFGSENLYPLYLVLWNKLSTV